MVVAREADAAGPAPTTADEMTSAAPVDAVTVRLPITLGQFLKTAGLVSTGGEAKQVIAAGLVTVNGEVDTRRGRKLAAGDVVTAEGAPARVAVDDEASAQMSGPAGQ